MITHRNLPPTEEIIFTEQSPAALINELKQKAGKTVWICGGAAVVQQLMEAGLIDDFYISVIPTILGSGIRLFGTHPEEIKLKLLHTQSYNGIVDLVYTHR